MALELYSWFGSSSWLVCYRHAISDCSPSAWAVVEVGQGLSDWGLDKALVQRSHVTEYEYNAAWTLDLLRCLALATVIGLAAPVIAAAFGEVGATNLIRVLALTPAVGALTSIKRVELLRRLDFRSFTLIRLPEMAIEAVIAIALAPRIGVWALAVAALISICCTCGAILRARAAQAPVDPRLEGRLGTLPIQPVGHPYRCLNNGRGGTVASSCLSSTRNGSSRSLLPW